MGRHDLTAALLSLLSEVLAKAKSHLNEKDLWQLKASIVQSCDAIHSLTYQSVLWSKCMKMWACTNENF
ncbi:hypothetical protein JVT61DRAFT_6257 [Boletus reticuloceps]|uniref:Uncharacterized protein n=1 Tax=Boletus reticuloceps TaxID=495285 RepID=A0A8I2YKP7_9AGAM|nr:hypothetical protein JVT61DRAFT_6257 [Boletus reticuloceps]